MASLTLYQFIVGFGGVIGVFAAGIACKALLGFDPPLGEVVIAAIVALAGVRIGATAYTYTEIQKTNTQITGVASQPTQPTQGNVTLPSAVPEPRERV